MICLFKFSGKRIDLIRQGEGISVEFKTCRNQLNRNVYETVCAFLNRYGGTILFFREIDRADELGSGMRNLMKYGKAYGGADPQLIEQERFSHTHQRAGIQRETRGDG